jgi:hypothetical protein
MSMDLRAADPHVLFGRTDLDEKNNLRFAFSIEAPDAQPVLVFRNGGLFAGILRDSRTQLIELDGSTGAESRSYRFCAQRGGCDYIDARFGFSDATHLALDVKVKNQQHLFFSAVRKESRILPEPFPVDDAPQGGGDAPFPPMPRLLVTVTWDKPLPKSSDILVVLSTTACNYLMPADLGCTVSRSLFAQGAAGDTSAVLVFEQIHSGSYKATAILDRSGQLRQRLVPRSGDGVSLPNQDITVETEGDSRAAVPIVLLIP